MYSVFESFLINENIQQAKTILKELDLDPNKEQDFKDISKSLERLPNLIGKFVEFQYKKKSPKEDVKRVMTWLVDNRDLMRKLPKNVLEYETLEQLEDDIQHLKINQKVRKFYNNLYASMRSQVDKLDKEKRKEFDDLSLAYMNLPMEIQKQFTPLKYFERNNISIQDFVKALHSFVNKTDMNEEQVNVMNKITKYGDVVDILYNMNNILVVETDNSKAVCDLGSQSWCIVYGGESTRQHYFGPESNNTQLLIFNFNLPATSAMSLIGVTIKPDMTIIQCQDKLNHYVSPERIMEMTGLPESIFKPNEIKAAAYVVENAIKTFLEDTHKIADKHTLDLPDLIDRLVSKLNEIQDKEKVEKAKDLAIVNTFKRLFTNDGFTHNVIINTFGEKSPSEIYKVFKENKYVGEVVSKSIDYRTLILIAIYFTHMESCHFFIQYSLEHNKSQEVQQNWVEWYMGRKYDRYRTHSSYTIWMRTDTTNLDKEKYPIKISEETRDKFVGLFDRIRKDITGDIIIHPTGMDTFENYETVYKFSKMKEEFPYEFFFQEGLYIDASKKFMGDEKYRQMLVDTINYMRKEDIRDDDFVSEIARDSHTDYSYDILDKYDDEIVELYEKTETSPKDDHILGLLMYKKTDKFGKKFKEQMKVQTTEKGEDYVVVSDFTSFDDLIFKREYFNSIEDYDPYYEKYDDYTLKNYADDLDIYNIVDLSMTIKKEFPETFTEFSFDKYLNEEGKINRGYQNKYEKDEELKKLDKYLQHIIFEDEDELDEINEDLYNYMKEDIKKDIFNRALNDAYNNAYHSALWRELMESVQNAIGSDYWDRTEEEIISGSKKPEIYKFVKNDKDGWDLLFRIDIAYIADSVESYSDLFYNCDSKFDWEGLVRYVTKVQSGPIEVDLDRISAYADKQEFNEAIRNL